MTKVHFARLAAVLKATKPEDGNEDALLQWYSDVEAVADVCRDANMRFDLHRFAQASTAWSLVPGVTSKARNDALRAWGRRRTTPGVTS